MIEIEGGKDIGRRKQIEQHGTVDIPIIVDHKGEKETVRLQMWPQGFRKTALTYAIPMAEAFVVDTLEGRMEGKPGDYLAIGVAGEMYPVDAAVMAASYEAVDPTEGHEITVQRIERMRRGEFG
jgi:hypothetical protein